MPSPGPTETMLARQVRIGDVLIVDEKPYAVTAVLWTDSINGEPLGIALILDDNSGIGPMGPDTPLDVTRPFQRHDVAGPHDEPAT